MHELENKNETIKNLVFQITNGYEKYWIYHQPPCFGSIKYFFEKYPELKEKVISEWTTEQRVEYLEANSDDAGEVVDNLSKFTNSDLYKKSMISEIDSTVIVRCIFPKLFEAYKNDNFDHFNKLVRSFLDITYDYIQ